ncbi:TOBE domain-containing protein [Streptomyces sp. NPDC049949]|uniref:TOBE domain-containing protein n=1 Tax=Streptomyces sp. NPDC049949 TaxID=3154627 RepID=UPI00341E40A2
MGLFLGLGIGGIVLLAVSLVLDGVVEGAFDGVLDGLFDGWLSLPVVAGFVSMLGFTGAIVLGSTGLGPGAAAAAGTLAGAGASWLAWRLSRALLRDRSAVAPHQDDLLGSTGTVVTAIPAGGYGEVLLRLAGQPVKYAAQADTPLTRGAEVWVTAAPSSTSVTVRAVEH